MANKIVTKKQLSENVFRMTLEAPRIAATRKAGQFVIVRAESEWSERIPLTIADANVALGTIDIIFQTVGVSTKRLSLLEVGDSVADLVGPLGRPTEIAACREAIVVGGGIGIAPAHPIAQAFKAAGAHVTAILGARQANLIIMEDEMRRASDEVIVMTDDGSAGRAGLVTIPLVEKLEALQRAGGEAALQSCRVVLVGPPIMMKFAAAATRPFGVKTIASLNAIMIDGTGMCGGCRVTVGGETKFVCVEGPEFDAHAVDFDNFILRLGAFRAQEAEHRCRSGLFGSGMTKDGTK